VSRLEQLLAGTLVLIVLAVAGWLGLQHYGAQRFEDGRQNAIAERAQADARAVLVRTQENTVVAARQDATNTNITKEKDDEIADLRRRLAAAPRMRVGPAVCADRPPTGADPESAAGGNGADPPATVVSAAADRDLKQLILDVERDLATGRACHAFIRDNGLVP
jgi:hypothetical protein